MAVRDIGFYVIAEIVPVENYQNFLSDERCYERAPSWGGSSRLLSVVGASGTPIGQELGGVSLGGNERGDWVWILLK